MWIGAWVAVAGLVRADVKLFFGDHDNTMTIHKTGAMPEKFILRLCKPELPCMLIGPKDGYSLDDIRTRYLELEERRLDQDQGFSAQDARQLEDLEQLINAIEQPTVRMEPRLTMKYTIKGNADQFVRNIQEQLAQKQPEE